LLLQNRQYVVDTVHFWSYQPTTQIADIKEKSGFTNAGTFAFYAARPAISDSQTFNSECGSREQGTAILGCYANDRIYLYDITNQQLNGIKEVTAAHEMLHAIYQRLSDSERSQVDKLLEAEYSKLSAQASFAERMALYSRTEPGERDNELHSIIGTEVTDISPELEAHYKKYFSDRGKVLAMYNSYSGVFNQLSAERDKLSVQLDSLGKSITVSKDAYSKDSEQLQADIEAFNQRAGNNDFTHSQFLAERQALVHRTTVLEDDRQALNALVDQYNQLVREYNQAVVKSQDLYKSIDSTTAPAPKV